MQTVVGLFCVVLGLFHFMDRDREYQRSHYYIGLPKGPGARAIMALAEMGLGFFLLFHS